MTNTVPRGESGEEKRAGNARSLLAIVGIGASSGGLEALKKFFSALPGRVDIGFVIVQHLAPDHESMLPEILAKQTLLPVVAAGHGTTIEAGTIYVAPPGRDICLQGGTIVLQQPHEPRGVRHPIDQFLRSLARDQQQDAVGIILSGTGSDGTLGIREIKENGGMVMVQHPQEAQQDAMPLNAMETGLADYVEPAAQLAQSLVQYVEHNTLFDDLSVDPTDFKPQLEAIQHLLRSQAEYDFRHYKLTTLLRRVQRRMGLVGVSNIDEYLHLLKDRPTEVEALAQDLLICVTQFLRNPEAWRALEEKVFPRLLEQRRGTDDPIRIWIPGCATGEEAYTMAMLLCDALGDRRDTRVQIFASDISNHALKTARLGMYPETIASDLHPDWQRKYLTRESDAFRVSKAIREMVVFASHDLKGDPPFFRLDLISCRNLLIYLEPEAQTQILRKFHFALNPSGYLFLGGSETAGRYERGFEAVDSRHRIFRRSGEPTPPDLFVSPRVNYMSIPKRPRAIRSQEPSLREVAADTFWKSTSSVVLLLNESLQPIFVGGAGDRFLQIPEGEQRYTIYELVRSGIQLKLRSAIQKAEVEPVVRFEKATVTQPDGTTIAVRGIVRRVPQGDPRRKLFYVQLEDDPGCRILGKDSDVTATHSGENLEDVVRALERELLETREELSSTIEQLEQANEELQAAHEEAMSVNEELQSGTEELEASREELQSLNEELTTLNSQLEEKLKELEGTNNDLDNLISSTRIAVVFLDTQFRVRNFTPEAVDLFNLIRTDIGRPISDLVHKFTDTQFLDDAREVLKSLIPVKREVTADGGRVYLRRLLPYRTHDHRIEGVVATFQEITELKQVQEKLLDQGAQLRLVADAMPALIAYVDKDLRYQFANASYEEWFGLKVTDVVGKSVWEVVGQSAYDLLKDRINRVLAGERLAWEATMPYRHGPARVIHVEYIPHVSPQGDVLGYYALIQDITQRHKAEQAVRQSEQEFRAIFELAGSGKFQADAKTGRFLRTNPRFRSITGYSEKELRQKTLEDLAHPEDVGQIQTLAQQLEYIDAHWVQELRLVRKDRDLAWVLITGTLVRNEDGTPRFSVATVQDITSRKQAETALMASEERLQIALGAAHMGAWESNLDTGETIWDEQIAKLLGVSTDGDQDAPGHLLDFVHEEDRSQVEEAYQGVAEGRLPGLEIDFRVNRRDGQVRWFTGRGVLQADHGPRRILGVLQDITDRKAAEEALRESEIRFRDLADNIAQLAWTTDKLGVVTWYNRRWYDYTGLTWEESHGEGWRQCNHPDHVDRVMAKLQQCEAEETVWEDTFPLRRYDGTYRWFLSRAVPIYNQQGEIVRWFGTNTDITDQMELENALKEADRRKDEFLAMLAHELRNPLAPIRSGIDLMLIDPRCPKEPLEVMEEQVRHLVRLVDDLLDVSRITRGKVELRREIVQLQSVIQKAIHAVNPHATVKQIALQAELPETPIWLRADSVRLAQVFENLLINAVKYTPPQGRIDLAVEVREDHAVVVIRDTGIGIDDELMPRMFELFTQSSRSFDREQGGLGIGLTIVKSLVELHDGSVEARSDGAGKGSEFRVRLPITQEPPPQPDQPHHQQSDGQFRIMVVDDNQSARYLLSRLMQALGGHTIATAGSGVEALKQLEPFQPQVVMLDIGLPEMDGYEVARRIRENDPERQILLVAVTGYGQDEDRQHSEAAGFDVHLVKPVGIDDLRDLLIHPKLTGAAS